MTQQESEMANYKALVNVQAVVIAAIIAYRQNSNSVVKADDHNNDVPVFSNKTIALSLLPDINSTDEDVLLAQEMISALQQHITMQTLLGRKISSFTSDVVSTLGQETVPMWKVGAMVYIPQIYYSIKKQEQVNDKVVEVMYTSKAIGRESEKVKFHFTLLKKAYVQSLDCWTVFGKTENGDLVRFFTKKDELCKNSQLTAKVKSAGPDPYNNNATVTVVNYVKSIA